MTATKGTAIINSAVLEYVPYEKGDDIFRKGVIISSETGTALAYALMSVQEEVDSLFQVQQMYMRV